MHGNKGKKISEEHRRKLSLAKLGKKHTKEHNKNIGLGHIGMQPMLGKHHSEESKRKSSETHKKIGTPWLVGRKQSPELVEKRMSKVRGKNHWQWKGGVSSEREKIRHSIESSIWKNAVFARDGYICQKTGVRGGKLVAHHILNFSSYPELRFAIDNGITLSLESHKEFHRKYGVKNNNKEQIIEFLINQYAHR